MDIDIIYNEDCLSGMQRLPDRSIDMICCDLPYGVTGRRNECAVWDNIIPFEPMWEQYERIIKPNGAIVLFAAGMFTHQLAMSNPKLFKYNLVWHKGNRIVGFLNANRCPLRCHEDILVFGIKQPKYNPQKWQGRPYKKAHSATSATPIYNCKKRVATENKDGMRYPLSIIQIGMDNTEWQDRIHKTQKPVELIEYLIKTYSDEGDLILDNCMGSGTTAIACMRTGRHFVGFEMNEQIYKDCMERVAKEPVRRNVELF